VLDTVTITGGGTLRVAGLQGNADELTVSASTITGATTLLVNADGALTLWNGNLVNQATIQNEGRATLANKTVGLATSQTRFYLPFNHHVSVGPNSSLVAATAGRLRMNRGGNLNGAFEVAADALLDFETGEWFFTGTTASFNGAGETRVSGAGFRLTDNATEVLATGNFSLVKDIDAGAITGPGSFRSTGTFHWRGAAIGNADGTDITHVTLQDVEIGGSVAQKILNSSMTILGTTNWDDRNDIEMTNSVITNRGVFQIKNDQDVETGKKVRSFDGTKNIGSIQFFPDGKRLVTAGQSRVVTVWDVETGKVLATLDKHKTLIEPAVNSVRTFCFPSDGKSFYTVDGYNLVIRWDAETYKEIKVFDNRRRLNPEGTPMNAMVTPDGKRLTLLIKRRIVLMNTETGKFDPDFKGDDFRGRGTLRHCFCVSPDGKMLALVTAGDDKRKAVYIFNVPDLKKASER